MYQHLDEHKPQIGVQNGVCYGFPSILGHELVFPDVDCKDATLLQQADDEAHIVVRHSLQQLQEAVQCIDERQMRRPGSMTGTSGQFAAKHLHYHKNAAAPTTQGRSLKGRQKLTDCMHCKAAASHWQKSGAGVGRTLPRLCMYRTWTSVLFINCKNSSSH